MQRYSFFGYYSNYSISFAGLIKTVDKTTYYSISQLVAIILNLKNSPKSQKSDFY
jgi:hypothetical protein